MPKNGAEKPRVDRSPWEAALFRALAVLACTGLVVGPAPRGMAQPPPPAASATDQRLTQPQLEQMLAPIALYPDSLLMQMLMASTYPLEVVQAKRWLSQGQNASLRGDALAQALIAQPWDPSVKSLVPFPDVLTMMNDRLEWTQQLGDAVLAQQEDVMNAAQALRARAQAAGQLRSGPEQRVTVVQNTTTAAPAGGGGGGGGGGAVPRPTQVITIEPAQPDVVAVPVYNPSVAYGAWPYPANPPAYYPPPPGYGVGSALLTGMAFATGVAVVGSLWGWAGAGWGGGDVNVDVDRVNNINSNRNQISGNTWRHDERHRQGVAYRNDEVRNRVRAENPGGGLDRSQSRDQSREQFRGRTESARSGGGLDTGDRRGPGGAGGGANLGDRRPAGGSGGGANLGDRRPAGGPGGGANLDDRRPAGGPGGGANVADRRSGAGAERRPGGDANRGSVGHRPDGRPQVGSQPARQGPQGLQGVGGDGARERAAANRGAASRQGQPAARERAQHRAAPQGEGGGRAAAHHGGGGGARAGGGHRGGGGGGGRGR